MPLMMQSQSPMAFFSHEETMSGIANSLPLDRSGGLRGHVVDDAVDASDLVDDAGRDVAEEFVAEGVVVRRHAVE